LKNIIDFNNEYFKWYKNDIINNYDEIMLIHCIITLEFGCIDLKGVTKLLQKII